MTANPFIEAEEVAGHSVNNACRLLEVSRSAYYQRRQATPSARATSDAELTEKITAIHSESKGTYGSPRVHRALRKAGTECGKRRVRRLMRQAGLEVKDTKKPVGALNWHYARRSAIIRHGLLAPLPRLVSHLRRRCVVPTNRVGQGHRDHGAPASGACSRASAAHTCPISTIRSSNPRCAEQTATSVPVAILPGHPRHLVAMASRSSQAQVAEVAKTTRPWPTANERRIGRGSSRSGEPALGMHPDP